MISIKSYLLRAYHEWILDNGFTPYLLVDATMENVYVPNEFVKEGKIVLNVSPSAVAALQITNDTIEFDARFSGRSRHIYIPIEAVLSLYAKENGEGIIFEDPEMATMEFNDDVETEKTDKSGKIKKSGPRAVQSAEKEKKPKKPGKPRKPHLTVVK